MAKIHTIGLHGYIMTCPVALHLGGLKARKLANWREKKKTLDTISTYAQEKTPLKSKLCQVLLSQPQL